MSPLANAVLPTGSLIVVTGANGYVGSHVVDQFLRLGYRVRGVVRDPNKSIWLTGYVNKKYGNDVFELFEVKDLTDIDAMKKALEGSAGFVAVASDVSHDLDADAVTRSAVALVNTALEAAAVTPTLKRFVQTSSGTAALSGVPPGIEYDLAIDHFNTKALELAWAPPPHPPRQRVIIYSASKVLQEQAMWKFRDERKPKFAISAVLPDFVVGPVLDLEHQGYPSSLSLLKAAWEGDMTIANLVWPQWEIDVVDAAMLHVAAILHPDVDGERIFGYAYPKNWTNTFEYLRELYPERQFANAPEDEGEDKGNILGRPRAEELLKWVKGSGWTEYKVSLKGVCDTLV